MLDARYMCLITLLAAAAWTPAEGQVGGGGGARPVQRPPSEAHRVQNRRRRLRDATARPPRPAPAPPVVPGRAGRAPARRDVRKAQRILKTLERRLDLARGEDFSGVVLDPTGASKAFRCVRRSERDGTTHVLLRWQRSDDLPPAGFLASIQASGQARFWTLYPETGGVPAISTTLPVLQGLDVPATVFLPLRPEWYETRFVGFDKSGDRSIGRYAMRRRHPLIPGRPFVEATVRLGDDTIGRVELLDDLGAPTHVVRYLSFGFEGVHRVSRRWVIKQVADGQTRIVAIREATFRKRRPLEDFEAHVMSRFLAE